MAKFFLRLEGLDAVDAKIKSLIVRSPALAAQALFTSAIGVLVPTIRLRLKTNKSRFRGELSQKISARITKSTGLEPTIEVGAIGVPYAKNVEEGSPPGPTDRLKILEYVKKKLGKKGEEAVNLASIIIFTIEREGTKPHPFLVPTFEATKGLFFKDFVERMKANIGRVR